MKKEGSGLIVTLGFSILGLYASFLTWSILQERINTKPYGSNPDTGNPDFFKAPLVINIIQTFFAFIIGMIYSLVSYRTNPFCIFTQNEKPVAWKFFKSLVMISLTSSLSSPLGYESLKHVDYLAYLLAKSCKLIPVMLVHFVLYRTRFPLYKCMVAGSVTLGVIVFTLSHSSKNKADKSDGKTALGMMQLVFSMLLDGLTNSTQDQLFKLKESLNPNHKVTKITGAYLMCILNAFSFAGSLAYALIFKFQDEITYTVNFVHHYPQVMINILEFAILGSVGQVFVFIILEKFDSLILITSTVTRKMLSMILSVVLFGHKLNSTQWCGVGLVFGGIGYEALVKMANSKVPKDKKNE